MSKEQRERLERRYISLLYKGGSVQYQISERKKYKQEARQIKEALNA